jgi:hypothetical protein
MCGSQVLVSLITDTFHLGQPSATTRPERNKNCKTMNCNLLTPFASRKVYTAGYLGLISSFAPMYYYIFVQATFIPLLNKARSLLIDNFTHYCLGTSSSQFWCT